MFTPSVAAAYIMISLAAVSFGVGFTFQQKYSRCEGTSVNGTLKLSFFGSVIQAVLLLLISVKGGLYGFSVASACIAVLAAVDNILNAYFCVKVFESADMTLFSIFEMLGGMALPFVAGIAFFGEALTLPKIIGFVLITVALVLETGKASPAKGKALVYFIGLFVTNGLSGVIATMNARLEQGASTNAFMLMSACSSVIISGTVLLINRFARRQDISFANAGKAFSAIIPYYIIATTGNFLLLTALVTLDASVQYPMSTGGTIVVSAVISIIRKEKLKPKNFIAAAVAVASAIIIAM